MDRNGLSAAQRTLRGALIASALGLAVALLVTFTIGPFRMHMLGGRHAIYWLVAATGALVGVVVGNPIWRPDAGVEGALKGTFGAIAACALLYALRHLLPSEFDLGGVVYPWHLAAHPGILPMIAAPLGALFAFDHDEPSRVRVGSEIVHLRVEDTLPADLAEQQNARHHRVGGTSTSGPKFVPARDLNHGGTEARRFTVKLRCHRESGRRGEASHCLPMRAATVRPAIAGASVDARVRQLKV